MQTAAAQNSTNWPKRVELKTAGKRDLLDRFQRELDASERAAPMHHSYERIDPYVIEMEQAGHTYCLIIYHVESELWYAQQHWFDQSFLYLHEAGLMRRGDVVFDLGCNAGSTTCWYAMATGTRGHVHAFDPFPWNAIATRYNAELNGLHNVTVHQVGIGAREEKIDLSLYDCKTTSHHGPHVIEAQIHALSHYVNLKPDVLKIDIEGAEYELSHSDFRAFRRLRLCFLELHPWIIEARGLKSEVCLHNFMRHGFELRRRPHDPSSIYDGSAAGAKEGGWFVTRTLPSQPLIRRAFDRLPVPVQSSVRHIVSPLRPRGGLVRQLVAAVVEREAMIREREALVHERENTTRERERRIAELEAVVREREGTIRQLKGQVRDWQTLAKGWQGRAGVQQQEGGAADGDRNNELVSVPWRPILRARITSALPTIEGWCTERKALWLAELIINGGYGRILEVGIYGGRSFIPMAMALQYSAPGGRAYGVEAWSNDVAVATETTPDHDDWWRAIDLNSIKAGFRRSVALNGVEDIVKVLEMPSDDAFEKLKGTDTVPFDLIHVDGSHSEAQSLRDVQMWPELLRPGGVLVMDDILWPTVQCARDYVRSKFTVIEEVIEDDGVAYGAYRRSDSPG